MLGNVIGHLLHFRGVTALLCGAGQHMEKTGPDRVAAGGQRQLDVVDLPDRRLEVVLQDRGGAGTPGRHPYVPLPNRSARSASARTACFAVTFPPWARVRTKNMNSFPGSAVGGSFLREIVRSC